VVVTRDEEGAVDGSNGRIEIIPVWKFLLE
jgi:predicted AAA+ superfamily ATPase